MKRLFAFLLIVLLPCVLMAESEYYTDEADRLVINNNSLEMIAVSKGSGSFDTQIEYQYKELLGRLREIEPEFASQIDSMNISDSSKIVKIRTFLAQKAFDYYKELFMNELEQRSQETGRELKTDVYDLSDKFSNRTTQYSWLDRGELDTPKCHLDGKVRAFQTCLYPDGFEDVSLEVVEVDSKEEKKGNKKSFYVDDGWGGKIFYIKDMLDKNAHQECRIGIGYSGYYSQSIDGHKKDYSQSNTLSGQAHLTANCIVFKYDEFHSWRNQEVQDTINGKYGNENEHESEYQSSYLPDVHVVNRVESRGDSVSGYKNISGYKNKK